MSIYQEKKYYISLDLPQDRKDVAEILLEVDRYLEGNWNLNWRSDDGQKKLLVEGFDSVDKATAIQEDIETIIRYTKLNKV
jgi:hypothetical protein